MNGRRPHLAILAASTLVLALVSGCAQSPPRCSICHMPVPQETQTVAVVDGRPRLVCDPRCALTHQEQTDGDVGLQRVTDLNTQRALDPRSAVYVLGSDTAPDAHTADRRGLRTWPAGQATLLWHRCLPSVLAFATRDAAEAYRQHHGGRVATYDELGFTGSS